MKPCLHCKQWHKEEGTTNHTAWGYVSTVNEPFTHNDLSAMSQSREKKHAKRMSGTGTQGERLDCRCIELGLLI